MSTIKLNKARQIAQIGTLPQTWRDVTAKLPVTILADCTARQIAQIADAMYQQHHSGYLKGYQEAK